VHGQVAGTIPGPLPRVECFVRKLDLFLGVLEES
jgi:hypothetical protein